MSSPVTSPPRLPPLARTALLLDMDGTLLDIAPTPDAVVVPDDLLPTLRRLRARVGEALAVVSGRPIEQLAALLGDAPYALAGEHGGVLRLAPDARPQRIDLPSPAPDWVARAELLVAAHPGSLLEMKAHGFVVHYRAVPDAGPSLGAAIEALVGASPSFVLSPARKAWEVRPRGAHKGTAVAALMRTAPFAGRQPLFIGDDVTDEDGIAAAIAAGGAGLRVPERFGGSAARVRAWLAATAAAGEWPALPS